MLLDFGVVFHAVLLAIGGWWCLEILKRYPTDLDEFRHPDSGSHRQVIVVYWLLTAVIAVLMAVYIVGLLRKIRF